MCSVIQAFTPSEYAWRIAFDSDGHRVEVALRRDAPAEGPDVRVGVDLALAEQLRQTPRADPARQLHLPHPLLGVDVALGQEQVVLGIGGDLDHPVAHRG